MKVTKYIALLTLALLTFASLESCDDDTGTEIEFTGTVSGELTDRNTSERLADAQVQLRQGNNTVNSVSTSDVGAFSVSDQVLGEETYTVTFSKDGYYEKTVAAFTLTAGNQTKRLTESLDPYAKITGKVRDGESGEVIQDALVTLVDLDQNATTNILGEYEFDRLEDDTYTLRVTKSGFETQEQEVTVARSEFKNLDINLVELPAVLEISTTTLDFGANEISRTFEISNTGGDTINWSIVENIAWVTANPTSGKTTSSESSTVTLTVDRNGFNPGDYTQTLTVVTENSGSAEINLTMSINGAVLQIIPSELSFGTESSEESLQISRIGQGILNYEIQADKSWVTIEPNSGSVNNEIDFIIVSIDRAALDFGNYEARLAFNTDNGSQVVNATVTVPDPNAPQLTVEPTSIDFGQDVASRVISIQNTGKGNLTWQVSNATSWLGISEIEGTLIEGESENISINVDRSSLSPGDYDDVLRFSSNGGSENVSVSIEVANSPVISVSKGSLDFGKFIDNQSFEIANIGNGTMTWAVSTNQDWIALSPLNGTNAGTVNVTVSRDGLDFGNYSGQIDISSDGGNASVEVLMENAAPNDPPVASFSSSRETADLNETVEFDASNSSDAEDSSDALQVRWRFETGVDFTEWTSNKQSSYAYTNTGIKEVTLEVRDTDLAVSTASKTITVVENQAPNAFFTVSPTSGEQIDTEFQFDASSTSDDIDLSSELQIRWEWDTGLGFGDWRFEKTATHIYQTVGTKKVTLEVQDSRGLTDTYSVDIEVISNNDTDGDGVKDNVDADDDGDGLIEIFTIDELSNIRNDLDATGSSLLGAPVDGFTGYELMNDLDFNNDSDYTDLSLKTSFTTGEGWEPIGYNEAGGFDAIFDGNGHTISNLFINRTTNYIALFESVEFFAAVRNINIEIRFLTGNDYTAGLIGWNRGTVTNCSVIGTVNSTAGAAGLLIGAHAEGTVTNCFSEGRVLTTGYYIGGLIGYLGEQRGTGEIVIRNCYSTANVEGRSVLGGLLGGLDRNTSSSIRFNGTVIIESCYSKGMIKQDVSETFVDIGGFIGYFKNGTINSCYSLGSIQAIGGNSTSSSIQGHIGGFVGRFSETITACYSIGGIVTPSANRDVQGGFVGENFGNLPVGNYWDVEASSLATSAGADGKSTSELQGPTSAEDIYITWDPAKWDFGTSSQYPALKSMPNGLEAQRD